MRERDGFVWLFGRGGEINSRLGMDGGEDDGVGLCEIWVKNGMRTF